MFLRNSKFLTALLLFVFIFVYFGATACLALKCHICCPEQTDNCPIISLQKVPRSVQVKIVVPPVIETFITMPSVAADNDFQGTLAFELIDFSLPDDFLLAKISHLTNAPPSA